MFERPTNVPRTWPDGSPRSAANVFAAAYFVRGASPVQSQPAGKRGPKTQPASIVLPGTTVFGGSIRDRDST